MPEDPEEQRRYLEEQQRRGWWRPDPITELKTKVEVLETLVHTFVTRDEFRPVRLVVYGMVGAILLLILGALLSKVVTK